MAISPTSPLTYGPLRPASARAAQAAAAPAPPVRPAAAPAPAAENAAPPESTLWNLLTDDERSFFSQQATLGAITYGRGGAAPATARDAAGPALGQRLDVRG